MVTLDYEDSLALVQSVRICVEFWARTAHASDADKARVKHIADELQWATKEIFTLTDAEDP